MFKKVEMQSIDHQEQRYETVGDYWEEGGSLHFRVTDTGNWKYNYLVLLHEFVELALVKDRGIKIEDIDAFDIQYEKDRLEGKHTEDDEPGDDKNAPYVKEHFVATNIERTMAHELGVDWVDYEDTLVKFEKEK